MTRKKCTACGEEKPLSQFYKRKAKISSSHLCKVCERLQIREWRKNNKDKQKIINRRGSLKYNFGITLEQYDELLKKQKGRCAICDRHASSFDKNLAVDHNHETQEIRGLLCSYCNHRLIGQHKDADLLRRMADYIEQGTGWFVPKKKRKPRKRKKTK